MEACLCAAEYKHFGIDPRDAKFEVQIVTKSDDTLAARILTIGFSNLPPKLEITINHTRAGYSVKLPKRLWLQETLLTLPTLPSVADALASRYLGELGRNFAKYE